MDIDLLPDGAALVLWIESADGKTDVRVRRVTASGLRSDAVIVAPVSSARSSGYPRVARQGNELVFAWTEVTQGVAGVPDGTLRVRTAVGRLPNAASR